MKRDTILHITITTYIVATLATLFGVVGYVEAKDNQLRGDDIAFDITESGPLGLRKLQEINRQIYENRYEIEGFSPEYIQFLEDNEDLFYGDHSALHLSSSEPVVSDQALQGKSFGSSRYDSFEDLNRIGYVEGSILGDIRANNQPGWAKILAGIGKGVVTAGTTFLDAFGGLATGLIEMPVYAAQGEDAATVVSRLWDNEFSHAMKAVQDWAEEVMPNYYTQAELEDSFWKHMFSANFIGDKVIKNCLLLLMLAIAIPFLIIMRKRKVRSEEI